eukprot:CFRG8107T1
MVRKKIDSRVRTLVENGVKTGHRSVFVLVGDHGRNQIVNLHYILSKASVKSRPSVLWCYKKDLGFSSNRKKRMRNIKTRIARGLLDPDTDDPFELFVSATDIRYTYYADSHKILGQTFGMLVLQDFEALTPNLLARTVETVEGGGIVVLLLRTMTSLRQLYTMTMDVHSRFRTEAHQDVVARFNERFLLSLGDCQNCLVLDDELNVLPISSHSRTMTTVAMTTKKEETPSMMELNELKSSLKDTQPVGVLVDKAYTLDQAKALLTFVEAISEKTLRSTVTLTAARGRGKSAALGLGIAAAIAYGYSNIFVTSPTPENLKTVFEFVFKGFDALEYEEHLDYDLVESSNPAFNKAIVRVNIFRQHRQTIQYISPSDANKLGQAELLVIDEAAAIPLPLVRSLLGNYLVFMSSTINGYEGTGRSLSLKLIQQLRNQSSGGPGVVHHEKEDVGQDITSATGSRVLKELSLEEPIRYGEGDPIERWLYDLLCLDANLEDGLPGGGCPHPSKCELYYINRDTLFSHHKASEAFLQKLMALYVASHYKNSPNDLQLLSDAPSHRLFCLLGPVDPTKNELPEILCVVQVCLEGEISKESVYNSLARGKTASGDLIPWTLTQQFQDREFASLSGARIVRIATHPSYQKMGYGTRSVDLLAQYFSGKIPCTSDNPIIEGSFSRFEDAEEGNLLSESVKSRSDLPPLLSTLSERPAERLHWLGVAYGVTDSLLKFWKRSKFQPVYMRQTANELTGEHTCIMLKAIANEDLETSVSEGWLDTYTTDFRRRFCSLLSFQFKTFSSSLAMQTLEKPGARICNPQPVEAMTKADLDAMFQTHDLLRLESYAKNMVDYHVCMDLLPAIARVYLLEKLPVALSVIQTALLVSIGLQHRSIDDLAVELGLPATQLMALFNRAMRKLVDYFSSVEENDASERLPSQNGAALLLPRETTVDEELDEAALEVQADLKQKQDELIASLSLEAYTVDSNADAFDDALKSGKIPTSISVKSSKVPKSANIADSSDGKNDKRSKKEKHSGKKNKKQKTAKA